MCVCYNDFFATIPPMPSLLQSLLRSLKSAKTQPQPERSVLELLEEARSKLAASEFAAAQLLAEQVLDREPRNALGVHLLGLAAYRMRDLKRAVELAEQSVSLQPGNAEFLANLGFFYSDLGRVRDAVVTLRKALKIDPQSRIARSSLLFCMTFLDDVTAAELHTEHVAWAKMHADPLRALARPHANSRDPERLLRVGYVSADFRRHAVSYFIEPVLARHDRNQARVHCYYNGAAADDATARLRACADVWRDISRLDDDAAAELIRADGIDILVDLSGHLRGNRLLVFARKPAPLQITWLGYLQTTGMRAMDYKLTDALTDPPGEADRRHTEALLRQPHCQWCYQPPADAPGVNALPALAAGAVTFGSFNRIMKISPHTVRLWARILRELPDARLRIMGVPTPDSGDRLSAQFDREGVSAARIELRPPLQSEAYWNAYQDVDIALDTFPYNGATTTCEGLWMGVPSVSRSGTLGTQRSGASLLGAVGLAHLAATSDDGYVAAALRLAGDSGALSLLRARLREDMRRSPLMDAAQFVCDLEANYRAAWRRWCALPALSG